MEVREASGARSAGLTAMLSHFDLRQGDCREVLRTLPDASVDSIVTDPPYELGFMGKGWDRTGIANDVGMWREALRVLRPGGHLLAFSGTRTYHRMVCAIEDAGFEIRDQIGWAYGSGFPKSLDVSKAIDKAGGASPREQSEMLRAKRQAAGLTREQIAASVGCTPSSVRDWEEGRARAAGSPVEFIVPSEDYRAKLADMLGYSADERRIVGVATDRRDDGTVYGVGHSGELRSGGHTDAARQWQGWGTALKPAWEPIVVARKPLVGTVAENVLQHGTGAINVDGCRVTGSDNPVKWSSPRGGIWTTDSEATGVLRESTSGRWPANLIHDGSDEVLAAFPASASPWIGNPNSGAKGGKMFGGSDQAINEKPEYRDAGSAARFFYCAKASKSDRGAGNTHPTVKPTDLMRYLCRLVTPPGGVVLDPFLGSGSTGKAAVLEGFRFIGIEQSAEYLAVARARINAAFDAAYGEIA